MEIQLQELIDQIKKDGVEVAESEADSIISAAKAEAERIIAEAKAEANRIMQNAKSENERTVKVSEDAIRQAGRNMLLSFREGVTKELGAVVRDEVAGVYSSEELSGIIAKAISAWTENTETDDISVLLNSADLEKLEANLLASLKDRLSKGVTLKANDNFDGGFRVAVNGGNAYYDYSADAVTQMLSAYLNPKVLKLLKEAE